MTRLMKMKSEEKLLLLCGGFWPHFYLSASKNLCCILLSLSVNPLLCMSCGHVGPFKSVALDYVMRSKFCCWMVFCYPFSFHSTLAMLFGTRFHPLLDLGRSSAGISEALMHKGNGNH